MLLWPVRLVGDEKWICSCSLLICFCLCLHSSSSLIIHHFLFLSNCTWKWFKLLLDDNVWNEHSVKTVHVNAAASCGLKESTSLVLLRGPLILVLVSHMDFLKASCGSFVITTAGFVLGEGAERSWLRYPAETLCVGALPAIFSLCLPLFTQYRRSATLTAMEMSKRPLSVCGWAQAG